MESRDIKPKCSHSLSPEVLVGPSPRRGSSRTRSRSINTTEPTKNAIEKTKETPLAVAAGRPLFKLVLYTTPSLSVQRRQRGEGVCIAYKVFHILLKGFFSGGTEGEIRIGVTKGKSTSNLP